MCQYSEHVDTSLEFPLPTAQQNFLVAFKCGQLDFY